MLKVLCGLCAEQPIIGEELDGKWTPPSDWLSILFGAAGFAPGCGLYMPAIPTERPNAKNSIYMKPLYGQMYRLDKNLLPIISSGQRKMPIGLEVSLFDLHFRLFMYPPPREKNTTLLNPKRKGSAEPLTIVLHRHLKILGEELGSGLRFCDSQSAAKLFVRSHRHVGREFKLRPCSAGSILTLRNKIEPLASNDLVGANATKDTINKTHAVNNCAGETGDPHHPRTGGASDIFEVGVE